MMYKLRNDSAIEHTTEEGIVLQIPTALDNYDYQQYLKWVAAGNTPEPYVPPIPTASELLAKLDSDNALTQRNLREIVLLTTEAFKQLSGGALDLSAIPGVAKVATVEAEATALRAQL